jgi:hypothetical protein
MDSIPIARSNFALLRNQHRRLVMGGLCWLASPPERPDSVYLPRNAARSFRKRLLKFSQDVGRKNMLAARDEAASKRTPFYAADYVSGKRN